MVEQWVNVPIFWNWTVFWRSIRIVGTTWDNCDPVVTHTGCLRLAGSSPRSGNLVLKLYSPMKQRSFTKIQGWYYAGHTIHGDSSAKKPSKIDRPFRFAEKLIWIKIVSSNLVASDTPTRAWPTIDSSPSLQDAQFQTYRFQGQNICRTVGLCRASLGFSHGGTRPSPVFGAQAIRCKILALGDDLNPQHCRRSPGDGIAWENDEPKKKMDFDRILRAST